MNKEQLTALIKYCEITFGTTNVSVVKCIIITELEAKYYGLNIADFLDAIANGRLNRY